MANEAGINLILKAPDVNSTMDEVIAAWKQISEEEKKANAQLLEYQKNAGVLRLQMKEWANDNKNIANALKEVQKADEEKTAVATKGIDTQRKGLFGLIREYFAQKRELKEVEKQIEKVNKELDRLALRQRAIHLDARRGNVGAIAEYKANNDRIKALTGSLGELGDRQDSLSAKVQGTNNRFAGFTRGLGAIKAVGVAAFSAVAVAVVGLVAVMAALGRNNEASRQQFEKTQKAFANARKELGQAFAPVTVAIGRSLELIASAISKFVSENKEKIQNFAINVGSSIAGSIVFIRQLVLNIAHDFQQLGRYVDIGLKKISAFQAAASGNVKRVAELSVEIARIQTEINNDVRPENPFDAYTRVFDEFKTFLQGQDYTKVFVDVKKLREEFEKLFAEFNKAVNDQAIKDAGPLGGIILKADLAAKEIEKMGVKLVDLAKKLGKSQEEVKLIQQRVKDLAEAIRDDAFAEVLDDVTKNIDAARSRLEDVLAKRAGTEDALAFSRDIGTVFDSIEAETKRINEAIQAELSKGENANVEQIDRLKRALNEYVHFQTSIAREINFDFAQSASEKAFADLKAGVDKQMDLILKRREELERLLSTDLPADLRDSVQLEFNVNTIELKTAKEQLDQLQASIDHFKETGQFLVVETEVTIRRRIEDVDEGIRGIQPDTSQLPGETAFGRIKSAGDEFFKDIQKVFSDVSLVVNPLLDIFANAADAAVEAINRELEAVDELIDKRKEAIDELEEDLEREADFKSEGLANDYDLLRQKIATEQAFLKADEDKRAEIKKKADEAEAKRLKIKQAQDTLSQVSSLITASANIWQSFSPLGPAGIVGAVAAIALMFTAFAASKLQAAKIAKAYKGTRRAGETFGELAPGEGYDDTPGPNRGLLVYDRQGKLRGELGGDEMVNKQSVSRKHGDFLWYLNQHEDQFRNVDLMRLFEGMNVKETVANMHVHHASMAANNDHYVKVAEKTKIVLLQAGGISKKEMQDAIAVAMQEHAQTMIDYWESRPDIIDAGMKEYYIQNSRSKTYVKG